MIITNPYRKNRGKAKHHYTSSFRTYANRSETKIDIHIDDGRTIRISLNLDEVDQLINALTARRKFMQGES